MTSPDKPISEPSAKGAKGRVALALFLSVFFFAGLGMTHLFLFKPLLEMQRARQWVETPCVIVSSEVQTNRDSDGDTYSIHIVYSYMLNGPEKYQSERYNFVTGSSSGYGAKAKVVAQYRPGKETICFVNPSDPTKAVLNRNFDSGMLVGLVPLSMAVIVGFIIVWMLGSGRRERRRLEKLAATPPLDRTEAPWTSGAKTFVPGKSRFGKLIGVCFICLFWNGIVSVFVVQLGKGLFRSGHFALANIGFNAFGVLFMIPFVLVGLVMFWWVGSCFLALFNPRVTLTLLTYPLTPGGASDVEWSISGNASRIRKLSVVLEGREEATYACGTSTTTDKAMFKTIPIYETAGEMPITAGRLTLDIPSGVMHSFASKNNKIIWALKIKGDIPRWPDIDDEYRVEILPRSETLGGRM